MFQSLLVNCIAEGVSDVHIFTSISGGITDKDVFPRHTRCLDTLADLLFVVIDGCGIDVTISGFQGDLDSVLDLIGLGLLGTLLALFIYTSVPLNLGMGTHPGAQPHGGNGQPVVEFERLSKRHFVSFKRYPCELVQSEFFT